MHASFKPVSAMIVESAYQAHALLSNSFVDFFLVQGIKEKILDANTVFENTFCVLVIRHTHE